MAVGMYEHFSRAVSWLKMFVTDLSPWRPTFDPRSVHVLFFLWTIGNGTCFSRVFRCLLSQYHSTNALHTHICHCYQEDEMANTRRLPNSNTLPEIVEKWVVKYCNRERSKPLRRLLY